MVFARLILGLLGVGAIACASPLIVPTDQIFIGISIFDELDVTLTSTGSVFDSTLPVVLQGAGTTGWTSSALTASVAVATGPALTALTFLELNLATQSEPVVFVVQVKYSGGEVRSVQLTYDGSAWSTTVLPPGTQPIPGNTPMGGSGGSTTGALTPNDVTTAPEPPMAGPLGFALVILGVATRRRG